MRYFLIAYTTESSNGSIWFEYNGFPSHVWLKETIVQKFKMINTIPAIMSIYEFKNEQDYNDFNSGDK